MCAGPTRESTEVGNQLGKREVYLHPTVLGRSSKTYEDTKQSQNNVNMIKFRGFGDKLVLSITVLIINLVYKSYF